VNHIGQKAGATLVNHISRPCPDCQGNGVEDCCHGHEAQPEEEMNSGRIGFPPGYKNEANALLLVLSMSIISGCAFLPAPLAYLNYARAGYDVTQIVADEPTLTDEILSEAVGMDCKIFNALDGEDICVGRPKKKMTHTDTRFPEQPGDPSAQIAAGK